MCSQANGDLRLFVKAGADGQRYGACPFCQRVFMVLLLKSAGGCLHFTVATVYLSKPPEEFQRLGLKHVPALCHGDKTYDTVDDILQYVDESFPQVNLGYDNVLADNTCKNFFSKFCFFLKEVSKDPAQLMAELGKINDYLSSHKQWRFLCGNVLTHLDCEVLPKLQHMRVAASQLKNLQIPTKFEGIWRYLYNAYSHEIFTKTCPCDQEIVLHWANKPETPNISLLKRSGLIKAVPTYSLDVCVVAVPVTIK